MTAPADECGVTGGCHACPLVTVCGDPAPVVSCQYDARPHPLDDECQRVTPVVAVARFAADGEGVVVDRSDDLAALVDDYLRRALAALDDAPDVDPAEPRPAGAGCCGGGCG